METEFVNLFIQKQKQMIDELMAKAVMLDTKATLAESKVQKLAEMEAMVGDLRKQINDLTIEKENYRQQLIAVKQAAKGTGE
mgnify:CR=1 FL=1